MKMIGAGNVPRAARPRAGFVDRLFHRRKHLGVLAHAEIIVAAPDRYRTDPICRVMHRSRELALMAQNIREDPIAPFALQLRQIVLEDMAVRERHVVPTLPGSADLLYGGWQGE